MLVSPYFHSWFGLRFVDNKPNIDYHQSRNLNHSGRILQRCDIPQAFSSFWLLKIKTMSHKWLCQQGAFDLFAACPLYVSTERLTNWNVLWFQRIFLSYLRHQPHTKLIHCSAPPPPPSPSLAEDILLSSSHNTTYNGRGNSFHFPAGWRRRRRASSGRPSVLPPGRPSTSTLSAFQRPEPGAAAPRKQGKSLIRHQTQKIKWEPRKHRLNGCLDVHYVSRSLESQ